MFYLLLENRDLHEGGLHQMKFADDTVFSEKFLRSDAEVACSLIAVII